MRKILLIACIVAIGLAGCSKDKSNTIINATTYLTDFPLNGQESRVKSNIAFIKGDAASITESEETVDAYFKSKPLHSAYNVDQYSEYVENGNYTVLVQIADLLASSMHTTYSYKKVTVKSGSETSSNVMIFKWEPKGYQPWNDKY